MSKAVRALVLTKKLLPMSTGSQQMATTASQQMVTTASAQNALTPHQQRSMIDEQSQLDEILNELLGEQMFQPDPNARVSGTVAPNYGSITRQAGNQRTVLSWESAQQGPTKRAVVTKEIKSHSPNTKTETVTVTKKEISAPRFSPSPTRKHSKDAFSSYGTSSTMHSETHSESVRDRVGSPIRSPISSPTPSRLNTLPFRAEYDDRSMDSFRSLDYSSDSEVPSSWLQQQQQKLRAKRESKESIAHRSEQEKRLVMELKNAQTSIKKKRAVNEADEQAVIEQFMQQDQDVFAQNGPAFGVRSPSPEKVTTTYMKRSSPEPIRQVYPTDTQKTEKSYFVSGLERPPFSTAQTKYTFSVSPPKSSLTNGISGKPPPSPMLGRASAPSSPLIPVRSSSRDAMVRSRSVTREWTTTTTKQGKKKTPPPSPARKYRLG